PPRAPLVPATRARVRRGGGGAGRAPAQPRVLRAAHRGGRHARAAADRALRSPDLGRPADRGARAPCGGAREGDRAPAGVGGGGGGGGAARQALDRARGGRRRGEGQPMNDTVQAGRAPVRLDGQLVSELFAKRPDLENIVKGIHNTSDFLLRSAAADVSFPSPSEMHMQGASTVAIARSKLQFVHRLLVLRGASLIEDAVRSMNESRLVSFALATRALLETTAF